MNKAFVRETGNDDALSPLPEMPIGVKNYITPAGYRRLQNELQALQGSREATSDQTIEDRERDQRIQYLLSRLETAEVVDPAIHARGERVLFGATVTYVHESGEQQTVRIVGLDEIDPAIGHISWLSPVAKALLNKEQGDSIMLDTPAGQEELTIVEISYPEDRTESDKPVSI